jgi:hypothetical protein
LIKALSDLKHLVVAPLSPQAHQLSSFEKDSNVEYLVDTQEYQFSVEDQIKRSETICTGGLRFIDKEVGLREAKQVGEC